MEYAALAQAGLPFGSGAIESAVRRVINLRLKGAGIFWHKPSAEAMLLLRCFAKAGRLQQLHSLAFAAPALQARAADKPGTRPPVLPADTPGGGEGAGVGGHSSRPGRS